MCIRDRGSLEVKDSSGSVVAQVDLKKDSQTAGKQGGHKSVSYTHLPVTISKIHVSCDCTTAGAKDNKLTYAPGESGVISAVMKTGNFSGTCLLYTSRCV